MMQNNGFRTEIKDFSLALIADSGQCFRMKRVSDKMYSVIAGHRMVYITDCGKDIYLFSCTEREFEDFWCGYFDLDADYSVYIQQIPSEDLYMQNAVKAGWGIRILRQDPWEMLITFLLSQRKSIPLIKRSVEAMCEKFGDQIAEGHYAFPTPCQLAAAGVDDLASCGLGYRTKYVMKAAQMAAEGELSLEMLQNASDDELKKELMSLYGVGVKVASCIMLYGYHRLDSVPVDVWMERAAKEYYDGMFPYAGRDSYAGVLQQYIFEYIRMQYNRK